MNIVYYIVVNHQHFGFMAIHVALDSLLIYDPDRSTAATNVWIAHPGPTEEMLLGKLCIITSLDGPSRINHELISILQDELKNHYYQTSDTKPERAFEQALQKTNQRLHRLIVDGVSDWVDRAHILVAVIHQQELWIAHVGQVMAFLVRQSRLHKVIEVIDRTKPNPLRIFSSVVSGQLEPNDRLLLCTPTLLDFFSLEKIRRTILDHQPSDTARELENNLLGVEARMSIGAIIAGIETAPDTQPSTFPIRRIMPAAHSAPQVSMETLLARERATEQLLSPSIWPAVRDIVSRVGQGLQDVFRRLVMRRPPKRRLSGTTSEQTLMTSKTSWSTAALGAGQRVWFTIRRIIRLFGIGRRKLRLSSPGMNLHMPKTPGTRQKLLSWLQGLDRRRRYVALIACLLIGILATSIVVAGQRQSTSKTKQDPSQQIAQDLNKAQAAILYGGEDLARTSLAAASSLINKLPNTSSKQKQQRTSLLAQLQVLEKKIAHVNTIANPQMVFDLGTVDAKLQPHQLYLLKNTVAVFDASRGSVVTFSSDGKNPTSSTNTLDTGQPLTGTVTDTGTLLFATNRAEVIEFDPAKKTWKPLTTTWPQTNPVVQYLSFFSNRVYALDIAHSDIVRFTKSTSALGAGTSWLKAPVSLERARAAVVDGSIFVLQPQAQVEEYQAGQRTAFHLAPTIPAATNLTRLWTSGVSQNLYLLEPTTHRFLVFTKQGALVNQYQSDRWTDLRDLVVNEKGKTAFVLNGTKVYAVPLLAK
ncbi:MAG: hypothetical protein HY092_04255 [Candidatus Kerfeldbacteria bacterium]|nr:hypothetical protein [Candidatus Kerfeldbacteria bacterium]